MTPLGERERVPVPRPQGKGVGEGERIAEGPERRGEDQHQCISMNMWNNRKPVQLM